MTAAVLLDHVSAYAAAVRSFLADLPPEQVEDLTDGLEADLAEALEDPNGAVATGQVALHDGVGPASMIDLTRRFGPAAAYAAELRSAAGLGPAAMPRPARRPVRERLAAAVAGGRERLRVRLLPLTTSRHWPAVAGFAEAIRPVWWVLRGWVWFVVIGWATQAAFHPDHVLVPDGLGRWALLAGCVVASVQWARGLVPHRRWSERTLRVAHVLAVVLVVPLTLAATNLPLRTNTVYIDNTVYGAAQPEDGVYVDGMQVSNLFMYDAEGNPLSGVQVFDDRGRQVRTTYDDGWQEWSLPGVSRPWSFAPSVDVDGRARWNVYPLTGAPADRWTEDGEGNRVLVDGAEPRTPPAPFAKAPTAVVPGAPSSDPAPDTDAAPESDATPDPDATSDADPDAASDTDVAPETGAAGATGSGSGPGAEPAAPTPTP